MAINIKKPHLVFSKPEKLGVDSLLKQQKPPSTLKVAINNRDFDALQLVFSSKNSTVFDTGCFIFVTPTNAHVW